MRRFNYFLVSTLSLILTGILNSKEKIFFFSLEKKLPFRYWICSVDKKNPLYYTTYNFQTSFLMVCITKLQIINTHVTKHMHCRIDNQKLLLIQIHFKLSLTNYMFFLFRKKKSFIEFENKRSRYYF